MKSLVRGASTGSLAWATVLLALLALFYWGGSLAATQGEDPNFAERHPFGTGLDLTSSLAVGDLNGDGHLDLVAGHNGQQNVAYLNDGSGGFASGSIGCSGTTGVRCFGTGRDATTSVVLGDLDHDGDLDIVVANHRAQSAVYLNDGTATFHRGPVNCKDRALLRCFGTSSESTSSAALGDVNGDGALDIVAGNRRQPSAIYLNDGEGNLAAGQPFGDPSDNTTGVAVGNLNGDDALDLVAANAGAGRQHAIYLNSGTGRFPERRPFGPESVYPSGVAIGDINGDRSLDIVVASNGQRNFVYLNDGSAAFPSHWSFGTGVDQTQSVTLGDLDGDGRLDIIAGNGDPAGDDGEQKQSAVYLYTDQIIFHEGSVSCGRSPAVHCLGSESDNTVSTATGDFDGDGDLDVVAGNYGQQNHVYLNNGAGSFPVEREFGTGSDATTSVAAGDFDGDGDLDLAAGNWEQPNALYLNDGRGNFPASRSFGTGSDSTQRLAVGDVDGDGDLDVAAGNWQQQNAVYLNDGSGNLASGELACRRRSVVRCFGTGANMAESLAMADFDGDRDLDLAVGNNTDQSAIYLNDGAGHFYNGPTICGVTSKVHCFGAPTDTTRSLAVGDLDGDGSLDLVVGNDNQQSAVYLNDGQGNFAAGRISCATAGVRCFGAPSQSVRSVAVGDLDRDGDLDVIVGSYKRQSVVYLNDGSARFHSDPTVCGTAPGVRCFGSGSEPTMSVITGDVNGDAVLDLVVGNEDRQNVVYLNDGEGVFHSGNLICDVTERTRCFGDGADRTESVAVGDLDGDGDLDLIAGNVYEQNIVALNGLVSLGRLVDDPPAVTVAWPGVGAPANFYPTSKPLHGPTVSISYRLFDTGRDPVRFIRAYYSADGGGQWFPATAATGTITTNLATAPWPRGQRHTFRWRADADLIRSENVVLRIEVYQGGAHTVSGHYQRPFVAVQTFPFPLEATDWYARVVDEHGMPIAGATVYASGRPVTDGDGSTRQTDRAGLIKLLPMKSGDTLVALSPAHYQLSTPRMEHDGWAYRVHLTTLAWDEGGNALPLVVSGAGEQRLTVRQEHPLVLFNLVVSVEWDASDQYLGEISRAMQRASDYLFDLTDGQMAFGQVTIFDDGASWADADIQIATENIVRPHAYVGGITSQDRAHVIRVGRAWDGESGNQGPWDAPEGYRTLTHEFAHYALFLYDEYFAYTFDARGNLTGEQPAVCTIHKEALPEDDAASASAMYYHYKTSELSAREVRGLWSNNCEATAQWQINHESAWETLTRHYSDTLSPPRWRLSTPLDSGRLRAGPEGLPASLPDWPQVELHQQGGSQVTHHLRVYGPRGVYWGALVALYKQDGRVIGQGFTDRNGALAIFGAQDGDSLRAASLDGGLAGGVEVGATTSLTVTLTPLAGLAAQSTNELPHLRVLASPSSNPELVELLVVLHGFPAGADPSVIATEPGSQVGQALTLSYSPATGSYEGQLSFSASKSGQGRIQVVGEAGEGVVRLHTSYRLQHVAREHAPELFSNDGNLSLHLEGDSLPGDDAYFVVMPPGALPGPPPTGLIAVGDAYDLTASGALVTLAKPAVLKLRYDPILVDQLAAPSQLRLYRWHPGDGTWLPVTATLDEEQQALVAPITTLGTYTLLAAGSDPMGLTTFLPLTIYDAR